jgi:hypothetical protein
MTILGVVALIALVVLGVMVLRVKSDPMENELIRKTLADAKRTTGENPPTVSQDPKSMSPPETK